MAQFRACPDTGLYFHKSAESLMKVNADAGDQQRDGGGDRVDLHKAFR